MTAKNSSRISHYFKTKEGLYQEVIHYLLARFSLGAPTVWTKEPGQPSKGPEGGKARLFLLIRRIKIELEAHLPFVDPLRDAATHLLQSEIHAPKPGVKGLILSVWRHPSTNSGAASNPYD